MKKESKKRKINRVTKREEKTNGIKKKKLKEKQGQISGREVEGKENLMREDKEVIQH